jgi:hypothetical protein
MISASTSDVQEDNNTVFCEYWRENNLYSCRIVDAVIADGDSREVQVGNNVHQPDRSDEDIVAVRIRNGNIPFIVNRLFTRFPSVFRLIIEPNPSNGLLRIQSEAFTNANGFSYPTIHSPQFKQMPSMELQL